MGLKRYKLGDLIEVTRGQSLAGEFYAEEGKYIRLTLGNFDYANGGFKPNTSKTNLYYTGPIKEQFILEEGDIITPLTEQTPGLLGSTARIPISGTYIQSQDVALVRCKDGMIDPAFCYYLLPSSSVKKQLAAGAQQTKIRHTSPDKIKDVVVDIPDISEQRRIGQLLDAITHKIELNRSINQNLEAFAKLLYDYWFVQLDFPNKEGKPYKSNGGQMAFCEELQIDIPQDWRVCRLSEFISKNNTGDWGADNPSDDSFEIGCIRGADIIKLNDLPRRYIKIRNKAKLLSEWDVVIEVSGGSPVQATGRSAFITPGVIKRNGGNITCSNFCHAFSFKDTRESAYFFFMWKMFYDNGIMFNYEGKTSGIKNFMTETFLANKWVKAPTELIHKFFDVVKDIYSKIDINIAENNGLIKQRDDLLPLLMNGQVSIKQLNSDLANRGVEANSSYTILIVSLLIVASNSSSSD